MTPRIGMTVQSIVESWGLAPPLSEAVSLIIMHQAALNPVLHLKTAWARTLANRKLIAELPRGAKRKQSAEENPIDVRAVGAAFQLGADLQRVLLDLRWAAASATAVEALDHHDHALRNLTEAIAAAEAEAAKGAAA
jgi:hypothetical protein